jgi:hypothetical protein
MITDDCVSAESSTGYEMLAAAHVAACARQIGYPDMESVVMRVIGARPANGRGDPFKNEDLRLLQHSHHSAHTATRAEKMSIRHFPLSRLEFRWAPE